MKTKNKLSLFAFVARTQHSYYQYKQRNECAQAAVNKINGGTEEKKTE